MSQEAAILLQEYQYNLFGNIRDLQREMAMALGPMEEAQPSPDTIMRRIRSPSPIVNMYQLNDQIEKRADTDILTPLPPLPLDDSPIRGMLNP
eukprot:1346309-Amorphochlora_amoeboformis.AAC.1